MKATMQMIFILAAAFTAATGTYAADSAPTAPAGLVRAGARSGSKENPLATTDGKRRAARAERIATAGGIVHVPPSGARLVVVDATAGRLLTVPFRAVEKVMSGYDMVGMVLETAEGIPFAGGYRAAVKRRTEIGAAGIILMVDGDVDGPVEAVYPEERVAVVSAASLLKGAKGSGLREGRLTRGLWRAIGFMFGSGYAAGRDCVMKPVSSVGELDALRLRFMHPMTALIMLEAFRKAGAVPARHGTYAQAVAGGWAPPPTNDVQRALWEKGGRP